MRVKEKLTKTIFAFALGTAAISFGLKTMDFAVADGESGSKAYSCFPTHASPPPSESLYALYESIKPNNSETQP